MGLMSEAHTEVMDHTPRREVPEDGADTEFRPKALELLKKELDLVLKPYREIAGSRLNRTITRHREVEHAVQVLIHHFFVSPEETTAHVMDMLNEFVRIIDEFEAVSKTTSVLGNVREQ